MDDLAAADGWYQRSPDRWVPSTWAVNGVPTAYAAREITVDAVRDGRGSDYGEPMPRPLLRTLVGDVLRRHRLRQRRTLADVARDARVSVPYLSEVERGRKEASSEVLAAVCGALRMELSDLLAEVWRDLAQDRAPVLRLAAAPGRPDIAAPVRRPGGAVLLAA